MLFGESSSTILWVGYFISNFSAYPAGSAFGLLVCPAALWILHVFVFFLNFERMYAYGRSPFFFSDCFSPHKVKSYCFKIHDSIPSAQRKRVWSSRVCQTTPHSEMRHSPSPTLLFALHFSHHYSFFLSPFFHFLGMFSSSNEALTASFFQVTDCFPKTRHNNWSSLVFSHFFKATCEM